MKYILVILSILLFSSCGGGGSPSNTQPQTPTPSPNVKPVVSISGPNTIQEFQSVTLSANATDSDGSIESINWSVKSGPDVFLTNADAADVSFNAPDVVADTILVLEVQVADNQGATAVSEFSVTITPKFNLKPVVSITGQNAIQALESLTLSANATDSDGNIASINWSVKSGPSLELTNSSSAEVSFVALNVDTDTIVVLEVQVTDDLGESASSEFAVTITPIPTPNIKPVVSITGQNAIQEFESLTLIANSSDADGNVTTILWSIKSGPTISLTNADTNNLSFTAPGVDIDTILVLEALVTDNEGATASSEFSVTITPTPTPNIKPVVSIAGQNTIQSGENLTLTANSNDPDGSVDATQWSITTGPSATLNNANTANMSFIAPDVTVDTLMRLKVQVTDNDGASASSEFSVTITPVPPSSPPTTQNANPLVNISGQNAVEEFESITLTANASDPDGSISAISWSIKSGPTVALSGADTANVSFVAPDVSASTAMVLKVQVTDNQGASASSEFNITVTPTPTSNIKPVVSISGQNTIQEFESLSLTANANDPDGSIASFVWTVKSGPAVTLTNANSSKVSFTAPDVAADTFLILSVQVADNDGETATSEFRVTITPTPTENIQPVVSITGQNAIQEFENVLLTANASDPDGSIVSISWSVKSGPLVTLNNADTANLSFIAPDINVDTQMVLTVLVTDNENKTATSDFIITITPTPVANSKPQVTISGPNSVQELDSLALNANASDPDGSIASISWSVKSGPAVNLVNANTANVSFIAPEVTTDTLLVIEVIATDNQGETASSEINVTITPKPNVAPQVSITGQNSAQEFENVELTANASDSDGSIASYSWSIKSGPAVALTNADSANVSFVAPDVSIDTTLVLEVLVTDNEGTTATSEFSLTITPTPNVAPEVSITGQNNTLEFENVELTAVASDSDGSIDTFNWSVKSGPSATLTNSDSAIVSFVAPDVDTDTSLVLQVIVTDNDGATATAEFNLTITPIPNTAPEVSITGQNTVQESENIELTAVASDSDGTITTISWSIKSGPTVTLNNADTVTVNFNAPEVDANTIMVLEVLVTDDDGATATSDFSITVTPAPTSAPVPFGNSALSFVSGYDRGSAVFYDQKLYISQVSSSGNYSFAMFEDVYLSTSNNVISSAPGIGYNIENYVPKGGATAENTNISSSIVTDTDNVVTRIQGYSVNIASGAFSSTTTLADSSLLANLNGYNGLWKDPVFSDLTINAGTVSATDDSNCTINGLTTNSGSKNIYAFDVTYSGCGKSGNYSGVLTLEDKNGVSNLHWMAFDDNNKGVFGHVDTQITHDESLSLTNKLKPSLYINNSKLLISTSSHVYSLEYTLNSGTKNPFIFEYNYAPSPPTIVGTGSGLVNANPATDATITIPATPEMDNIDIEISYKNQSNATASLSYSNLGYVSPELLLDNLEGQWGQLLIDASGIISGSVNSCVLAGSINSKEEKVAQVSITLSNCEQEGEYTGVIVGVDNDLFGVSNDGIITVSLNGNGLYSLTGIVGKSN